MKRVMLTVSYDGTNYCGWQIQPNANTIETELNKALSDLLGEEIIVSGASRTDTGVHALCNLAVFDTEARMPAEKISYALNQRLPDDIKIQKSQEVALDFHPRKCATKKTYIYRIYESKMPNPLFRHFAYFTYTPLNVEEMRKALKHFVGKHDFKSFCTVNADVISTVREITDADIFVTNQQPGRLIEIKITGTGFLYNMVRIIVGTLLEVGRGKKEADDMPDILEKKDRSFAGATAVACGLTLEKYEFIENKDIEIYE